MQQQAPEPSAVAPAPGVETAARAGWGVVDRELLAELCHDVRTPLHGALGQLELLLDRPLPADARELAQSAYDAAASLHGVFEAWLRTVSADPREA